MSAKGWAQVDEAWNNLSRRERLLIMVTAGVAPLMLLFVFVMEPALDRLQGLDDKIEAVQRDISSQERLLRVYQEAEIPNPNIKANKDLNALEQRLERLDSNLERFAQNLVSPQEMLGLLHSVLDADAGLKILEANSLPVEPLVLNAEGAEDEERIQEKARQMAEDNETAIIYIHSFELRLEGGYSALYRYLQRIEELHKGFFWDELEYQAKDYPKAEIRLKVHTLSTEENWLGA